MGGVSCDGYDMDWPFLFLSFLEILGVVCMSGFLAGFGKVFFNFFFGLDFGCLSWTITRV